MASDKDAAGATPDWTGQPAATVGKSVEHGWDPLAPGEGSPDVLIEGGRAWRAEDDVHLCARGGHGEERVVSGSSSVLINGKEAARRRDYLLGKGPADRIMEGASQVYIGAPCLGMASPDNAKLFCALYCALKADWARLTPAERQARTQALVKAMFGTIGDGHAPVPSVADNLRARHAVASFDPEDWQVNLPPGCFESDKPVDRASLAHELRHGEQIYGAMRERAGRSEEDPTGPSDPGPETARSATLVSPAQLHDMTGCPAAVCEAAQNDALAPGSPEARWAYLQADENLTAAGKARLHEIAFAMRFADTAGARFDAEMAYKARPGGFDAECAEKAMECSC